MNRIYLKFEIPEKGSGKRGKLCNLLREKYKKSQEEREEDIEVLVRAIREKIRADVRQRCGTMQVLDMTQPIALGEIYTDVNILENLTARQRLKLEEIYKLCNFDAEEFERSSFGKVAAKRVPGIEAAIAHPKLTIWGKPGAGKTTFLKHLAMQCLDGDFLTDRVPIFVTLKQFAEKPGQPGLQAFIERELGERDIDRAQVLQVLKAGKMLILLDGLDEVRSQDSDRVIDELQSFADRYSGNHFAITCRIAAKEYTFQGFKEVEVADFSKEQIAIFSRKWFEPCDPDKAERFVEELGQNKPIQELAASPLLLTLLCLVFGETNDFPSNRSELYKEGIDILLKKWDAKRNIRRDRVYKNLSIKRKEDLLSHIAFESFDRGEYFFKQQQVEAAISKYIRNLPDAKTDPEALQLDSEAVLKSIESQHGLLVERAKRIYSFSHLTFHEYFTADRIVREDSSIVRKGETSALEKLVDRVIEKRWREVFFLVAEMLVDSGEFLRILKNHIDTLVENDPKIQEFLTWLVEKANSVEENWPDNIREKFTERFGISFFSDFPFTLDLNLSLSLDLDLSLDPSLSLDLDLDLSLDPSLSRALNLSLNLNLDLDLDLYLFLDLFLSQALDRVQQVAPELHEVLHELKARLPDRENKEEFKKWWQANGKNWTEDLRAAMVKYRNIGHDWQFNEEQKTLLKQYWNANRLMLQILNRSVVAPEVRQEIEDTLFRPAAAIAQRKSLGGDRDRSSHST